eukprot:gene16309-17953_t
MDQLQLDLNLIKKEPQYFEDYGQNSGNILDNIIPEPDFNQFSHGASSVPNSEDMDQGVDWLSSFFDEPAHETCNVNGLNPPISKLSDISLSAANTYPSVVRLLGANSQSGLLSDNHLNAISDEYTNDVIYKSSNSVRSPSPDPFLGPSSSQQDEASNSAFMSKQATEMDIISALRKSHNFKILSQVDRQSLNLTTARELIQRIKEAQQQNNSEILREQRLGQHVANQKILHRNNITTTGSMNVIKKDSDSNDSDSGYESPSQLSPGRLVPSPTDKGCSGMISENAIHCEQSKERVPLYLSEEERRTLITEGLPIPTTTPLSKAEERALKKVRRKIKNKISAQESRRKKKEYMEALEKKIEHVNGNNTDLRKKVETLENSNKSLMMQLQKLQASIALKSDKEISTRATQTMVFEAFVIMNKDNQKRMTFD